MSEKKMDDQQTPDQGEGGVESVSAQKSQQPDEGRREVLRKILIGGGIAAGAAMLPDKWTKPVVDSIIAPAHAQTSTTTPTPTTPTPTTKGEAPIRAPKRKEK